MPDTKPYVAMASLSAALVTFAFGISVLAGYWTLWMSKDAGLHCTLSSWCRAHFG